MGEAINGHYDGEGANVAAKTGIATNNPGPVAASPDTWASRSTYNNGIVGGQGYVGSVHVDRRRRLRVSNEAARDGTAISVGGGDQVLNVTTRWVYIATTGSLTVRLADATADVTFATIPVGFWPLAIAVVRSGSTAAGVLLF